MNRVFWEILQALFILLQIQQYFATLNADIQ